MRSQYPEPCDVCIRFSSGADAVFQAEIDLLIQVWPELLAAMQATERLMPANTDSDLA
jgi:hypothetical protein